MPDNQLRILHSLLATYFPNSSTINILRNARSTTQNFFITVENKNYVLKIYSGDKSEFNAKTKQDLLSQLAFMDYIRLSGTPCPKVVKNRSGDPITEYGYSNKNYVILFEYIEGIIEGYYNRERVVEVAKALLNIRKASLNYLIPSNRKDTKNVVKLYSSFYKAQNNQEFETESKSLLDYLFQTTEFQAKSGSMLHLEKGYIHNNLRLDNLLFENNVLAGLLDFDEYKFAIYIEEIVNTLIFDLENSAKNIIRAGFYNDFIEVLKTDETLIHKNEFELIPVYLKARFLYEMTIYGMNNLYTEVNHILSDKNIRKVLDLA